MVDQAIQEICRRAKVSQYLAARGVQLARSGSKLRCKCPFPDHQDDTPSFYITTMPDGAELYKCYGACGRVGNIITIMHEMERIPKREVVRRLSGQHGVKLGEYAPADEGEDLMESRVLDFFCREDNQSMVVGEVILQFIEHHRGNEDAVNKASKIYQQLDRLVEAGDMAGITGLLRKLKNVIHRFGWGAKCQY